MIDHIAGFIDDLEHRLAAPLPGHDAFMELAGYRRPRIDEALRNDPEPRESAVLILLFPHREKLHTVLIERPKYDGVHSGQIAFPGGRREPEDVDLCATSMREFEEETGMPCKHVRLVGALSRLYIPPSRSLVTPYVAFADAAGPFTPDPGEVATLIQPPLELLLERDILKQTTKMVRYQNKEMTVPYFDVLGHEVWGATAMMIAELRLVLGE